MGYHSEMHGRSTACTCWGESRGWGVERGRGWEEGIEKREGKRKEGKSEIGEYKASDKCVKRV